MATKEALDGAKQSIPSGKDMKIGVVVSNWNGKITDALLQGCLACLNEHDVEKTDITIRRVPGSYELPMGAQILVAQQAWDAIVCLGCIIKGETKHDEYIAQAVANGLMQLGLMSNTPVVFGVLTPNSIEQAEARAGGAMGNKGVEAAETALVMACLKKKSGGSKSKIGFA